jgi:murein DD-endopeptidase / murein LD-carboxypeptidase
MMWFIHRYRHITGFCFAALLLGLPRFFFEPVKKNAPDVVAEKIMPEPFYEPPSEKNLIAKYAGLLNTDQAYIQKNIQLYRVIDQWMGTPYKWGGCSRRGIDCSCFVMTLFRDVFNVKINRTTFTQFYDADVELFTNRSQYQLGDLIFFKTNIARETRKNRITHVGLYLTNGYFVQSSSSGVNIANLNRGYWKNCIVAAGRLKGNYYRKARIAFPEGEVKAKKDLELEEDSYFDPVPYPEDMEVIVDEFSALMDVNKDKFLVPEVFEFVKRNQYAPYKINNLCGKGLSDNNCFISTLFRDVFAVEFEGTTNTQFLAKNTVQLPSGELKSFLDIVQLRQEKKGRAETLTGVYLYNNFFLYLNQQDITISNLTDSAAGYKDVTYFRINEDILKKVFENILSLRKGTLQPLRDSLPQQGLPLPQQPAQWPQKDTIVNMPQPDTAVNTFVGPLPDAPVRDSVAAKPPTGIQPKKKKKKTVKSGRRK